MRALLTILALSAVLGLQAQGLQAPILHCVSVDDNDDVTLTWQAPSDPDGLFIEYRVWREEYNPPDIVALATYTDINMISHFDNTAGFQTPGLGDSYFVEAVYDGGASNTILQSQNVHRILLETSDAGYYAGLRWNRPLPLADSLNYEQYTIEFNITGAWEEMRTQAYADTSFEFEAWICNETLHQFRIRLDNIFGCSSYSNVEEESILDETQPSNPVIETVTVDTTGYLTGNLDFDQKARVCWYPNPDRDISAYTVQYGHPTPSLSQVNAGTSFGASPTELLIDSPLSLEIHYNVVFNPVQFVVLAFDDCPTIDQPMGQATTFFDCEPHTTMHLSLDYNKCDQSTSVSWTPYVGWENGIANYVVYGGLLGEELEVLDTIAPGQTSYLHQGVPIYTQYGYLIKALPVDDIKPSLSAIRFVETDYPQLPAFTYLANVSVLNAQTVELKALVPPAAIGTRYRFERLNRFGDGYDVLISLPQAAADGDGYITWLDQSARPSSRVEEYRIVSRDSCAQDHATSPIMHSILMNAEADSDSRTNNISWSSYINWSGGLIGYEVYRIYPNGSEVLVASLGPDENRYAHVIDEESLEEYISAGDYCYRVVAVEGIGLLGAPQRSSSNRVCVQQEPAFFLPSAITPNGDGLNDTFFPSGGFFDRTSEYRLSIFDRWGGLIYESDNFYKPWTGEDNSGMLQEGVYVYQIQFRTGDGQFHQRQGTVTVLLPESE